jgi:hypothetical protein
MRPDPISGAEAMGDGEAHGSFILKAIGVTLWLFISEERKPEKGAE